VAILAALAGCGRQAATVFINPEFNFGYIERVAVVPFENLTQDQGAAARIGRLFIAELFAAKAFDIVEPGEVSRALERFGTVRAAELTAEQIEELGQELHAQGIIFGSVTESSGRMVRTGEGSACTLVVRMVETEQATTVWSATATAEGRGFWSRALGTGSKQESEVARECVDRAIRTLIR
jgi:TolB-like protein